MISLDEIKLRLSEKKDELQKKYYIMSIGIFGSYIRNEATEESDIDILVEFDKSIGLEFVSLADELENILNRKVDLVSAKAVKRRMMKQIEQEVIYV